MTEYVTVRAPGEGEIIINKSRFICAAWPCATEEEALGILRSEKERTRDASHHCWAYILGANMGQMRYSDDGEPGGTAGLPIIETMKARQVTNCLVIITRYFGGILLGAGGLTRAYRQSCKTALDAAGIVRMIPSLVLCCTVSYALADRVRQCLAALPVRVLDTQWGENVRLMYAVRVSDDAGAKEKLTQLCGGKAVFEKIREEMTAWEETGQ